MSSAAIYMARDVSRYMARVLELGGVVETTYDERPVLDGGTEKRFCCRMQLREFAEAVTGKELAPCVEIAFQCIVKRLHDAIAEADAMSERSRLLSLLKALTCNPMP